MSNKLTAVVTVFVNATPKQVWKALTDPALIKQYFFGTDAVSDWKEGSPLYFKGVWEGKEYLDKGTILASEPEKLFRYNYWSSFSGTPDIPENYAVITYALAPKNNGTELRVEQNGIDSEERRLHSEQNWKVVLEGMKKLLEERG